MMNYVADCGRHIFPTLHIMIKPCGVVTFRANGNHFVAVGRPIATLGRHPPRGWVWSTFESTVITSDGSDTCGWVH